MSGPLRFGFIGCGEIVVQTSKAIHGSPVCQVVHCMDVQKSLAEDLAAVNHAKATDRVEDLLADEAVQAVIVSVPHHLHASLTIQALRAGKHVLVEKPIARNLIETDEMIAAADETGLQLGVLHPRRFDFASVKAAELVAAGAIGKVLGVRIDFIGNKCESYWAGGYTHRAPSDWRARRQTSGGGVVMMNIIHNLDALVSIIDPHLQRIYGEYGTLNTPVEVEDFATFVARLEGGAILTIVAASAAVGAGPVDDVIYGSKGQIAYHKTPRVYLAEPWGDFPSDQWVEIPVPADYGDRRQLCVEAFARAVLEGKEFCVSGRQGRRMLEIVRGAYLSMERGRPVEFPVQE